MAPRGDRQQREAMKKAAFHRGFHATSKAAPRDMSPQYFGRQRRYDGEVRPTRLAKVSASRRTGASATLGGKERRATMMRILGAGLFLAAAAAVLLTAERAAAQDPLGGAIVGGAIGGILGGAIGHGAGGVIAGAAIGATTGALIAAEAQQRPGGYYWWRGGCYYQYPKGSWLQVQPGYCSY
jgi:hypothetical protein